uniref:Leucine rich repeat containing 25 n=1 Tax=Latimeria chalumnae TaxID=7897 RepID=H3B9H8_LATCH
GSLGWDVNLEVLILKNSNISSIINSDSHQLSQLTELDLSYNKLQSLPKEFLSQANSLKNLSLQHNKLKELPSGFLKSSSGLTVLSLEGNPLASIPMSVLRLREVMFTVDCKCDIVGNVIQACKGASISNCTVEQLHCLTVSGKKENGMSYYKQNCQGSSPLVLYISIPLVVVTLGIIIGLIIFCRKRKSANINPPSGGKQDMNAMGPYGQPRYESTAGISGHPGQQKVPLQHKDYENVLI